MDGFRLPSQAVDHPNCPGDPNTRWSLMASALNAAQDGVLDALAEAVGPDLVRVMWLRPAHTRRWIADTSENVWELWRQDDAGHRYLMQDRLTEQEAHALAARYESRDHKQLYWASRALDDSKF